MLNCSILLSNEKAIETKESKHEGYDACNLCIRCANSWLDVPVFREYLNPFIRMLLPIVENSVELGHPEESMVCNLAVKPFGKFIEPLAWLHVVELMDDEHGKQASASLLLVGGNLAEQCI